MASMWDDWIRQASAGLAAAKGPKALTGLASMVPESAQGATAFGLLPALLGPSALFGAAIPMMMRRSSQEPAAAASATPEVAPTAPAPRPLPMLVGQPMPTVPAPPPRPSAPMPLSSASSAPSVREGFMQRLLGGPNYQSNNMPVVMSPQGPMASGGFLPQSVNWGDPESAADFFRADQAARQLGLLG